jgi:TonB family protein
MTHGIDGFFQERKKAQERVSLLSVLTSAGLFGLLIAPSLFPPLQRAIDKLLPETMRFGYEGQEQFVRRIELIQSSGNQPRLQQLGKVEPVAERKGGETDGERSVHPRARPQVRTGPRGPGTSQQDLIARSISRLADVPVVQSEDLVIEILVRPEYPNALLERDVEGRVTVQALVDTVGKVVDVQVMASSGESLFERAAETAVWQCRFRPYRRGGALSEVYAVFRFSFKIYD